MNLRIGDDTHYKKQHSQKQINTRGATPIEKNIIVVDEQGNEYEATYPKRAKGLVKSGRARFVGENKICLACPPKIATEETSMSDTIQKIQVFQQIAELQKRLESIDTLLFKIQTIREEADYSEIEDGEKVIYSPEVALAKVDALRGIIMTRETTLRKMLDFYIKLYRELDEAE